MPVTNKRKQPNRSKYRGPRRAVNRKKKSTGGGRQTRNSSRGGVKAVLIAV